MAQSNQHSPLFDDKDITGLNHLLDTQRLLHSLQKAIPDSDIHSLHKNYIRYKPGTSLLVRYRMDTQDGSYDLYAKSYNPDESKLDNSKKRSITPVVGNVGHLQLPQHHTEVYFFPNDARLRHLQRLQDKQRRMSLLKSILKNNTGNKAFREATISTLQYKPERRYVACLTADTGKKAVLKAYRPRAYEQTLEHLKQLKALGIERFPELIGQHEKYQILLFQWRKGEILSESWQSPYFDVQILEELAQQLAEFHQGSWQQVVEPRKNNLTAILQGLAHLTPHLQQRSQELVNLLQAMLQHIPAIKARCHGDFYAKQILIHYDNLFWLDLDDICMAHPGRDLATFVAHLEWDVLRGRLSKQQAKNYEQVFVSSYQEATEYSIEAQHINALIALHLFQLIHHPFRSCEPNWLEQTEQLLTQIEKRLRLPAQEAQRQTAEVYSFNSKQTAVHNPYAGQLDAAIKPLLESAIDPEQCQHWFERYLTAYKLLNIEHIKVIRYKAGKRALVEYRLLTDSGKVTLLGKIRAKGLHRSIYKVNHQLHEQRHTLLNDAGWQVPPPLCMIPDGNMWLQQKVPGIEFTQLLEDAEQAKAVAKRIAKMSYSLHHSGIKTAKSHSIIQELEVLKHQLCQVAEKQPELKTKIHELYGLLTHYSKPLLKRPYLCIHRDFYPDQIMVNKDRLYLLDLDLFCMGDPCLDIGNFVAHVQEQALREKSNLLAYQAITDNFIQHYLQLSGNKTGDAEAIESYRLLSLARHIAISQRVSGRSYLTPQILELSLQQVKSRNEG